jgi:hypothetical protein
LVIVTVCGLFTTGSSLKQLMVAKTERGGLAVRAILV